MWNRKVFSDPQDEETWTWNPTRTWTWNPARTWPWIIRHEENPAHQAQAPDMIKSNRWQWKIVSPCVNRAVFPNPEPSSTPRQCDQCVARTRVARNQPRPQIVNLQLCPWAFFQEPSRKWRPGPMWEWTAGNTAAMFQRNNSTVPSTRNSRKRSPSKLNCFCLHTKHTWG